MKKETYIGLSVEELQAKEKTFKTTFYTTLILQIILAVFTIYLAIEKKQFAFIAISSGVLPSLIFMYQNLKKVQEELNKRI